MIYVLAGMFLANGRSVEAKMLVSFHKQTRDEHAERAFYSRQIRVGDKMLLHSLTVFVNLTKKTKPNK